ncbi:MAG: hypothetical protein ACON5H_12870 [Akkermansiaceae bacterium]
MILALYFGATEDPQERTPIEGEVTLNEMRDYLSKMNRVIGPRNLSNLEGQTALKQTASMIEGTLGPMNLGYHVSKSSKQRAEGVLWKTLWVDAGNLESNEVIVVNVPYGESGTSVAFALGFAEYLVGLDFQKKVRLVFTPPVDTIPLSERILSKGESITETFLIRGGGSPRHWAEVSQGKFAQVVGRTERWKEHVLIGKEKGNLLRLRERGAMASREYAAQIIQAFPLLASALKQE